MHDDLDLRVIERDHDADPRYREALRQRLSAILDSSESRVCSDAAPGPVTIDLAEERLEQLELRRRRWVFSSVALAGAAAVVAILAVTPGSDSPAPLNQPVPTTGPNPTALDTHQLFAEIAPGEMADLPDAPIGSRIDPAAVWTGTEMIVWGGLFANGVRAGDGAALDLRNGTWRVVAPAPISRRQFSAAVWTGTEVLVWGGDVADDVMAQDGAAYNPTTDTWRLLSPTPVTMVRPVSMVWTGDQAVLIGGDSVAAYDPVTDSWRRLTDPPSPGYPAIWAGDSVVLVGIDFDSNVDSNKIMRYELGANRWSVIDIGPSTELVGIPGSGGQVGTFVNLPPALGTSTQILDGAGNPIGELPAFPGDPSLFGDGFRAIGMPVGSEVIFVIWPRQLSQTPKEQVWALNTTTRTWRQLDEELVDRDALVVADDLLLAWGKDGDPGGVAYRSGANAASP